MDRKKFNLRVTGTEAPKYLTKREKALLDKAFSIVNERKEVLQHSDGKRIRIGDDIYFKEIN